MPPKAKPARQPRAVAPQPEPQPEPRQPEPGTLAVELRGSLDRVGLDGAVDGWCWSPDTPGQRRDVAIALDGVPVLRLSADLARQDLTEAGFGDGRHAFSGRLPREAMQPGTRVLAALIDTGSGQRIGAPIALTWPDLPMVPESVAVAATPLAEIGGNLDRVTRDGWVSGWCWQPQAPGRRLEVEILVGGGVVGRTLAAGFRADLQLAGISDGAHGFAFALPYDVLAERGTLRITAREAASQAAIGEPVVMRLGRLAETEQRILDLERQVRLLRGQLADAARNAQGQPAADEQAARALFGRVAGFFQSLANGVQEQPGASLAAVLDDIAARLPAFDLARPASALVLVCIPASAPIEALHRCLAALADSGSDRLAEIALFDDAGADPRAALLPNLVGGLRYVRVAGPATMAQAMDAAIRQFAGPLVAMLSPHALAAEGWLDGLIETLTHDPRAALASAVLVRGDGLLQHAGLALGRAGSLRDVAQFADAELPELRARRRLDAASAMACVIDRARLLAAGGLDHAFHSLPHAVVELSLRLRAQGGRLLLQPAASLAWGGSDADAASPEVDGPGEDARRLRLAALRALDLAGQPAMRATAADFAGHALVVEDDIPRPDQDAGSIAAFEQMVVLCELGWRVTFIAARDAPTPRGARQRLERAGIEVLQPPHTLSVGDYLREHGEQLDLVHIYRHHNAAVIAPQVREWAARAKLVFSPADLHFLREARAAALAGRGDDYAGAQTRAQELACVAGADASLVVSDYELDLLRRETDAERLYLLRWITRTVPDVPGFAGRHGVLFIGNFNHPPNADAVTWYAEAVVPLVRAGRPDIVLHVVGANASLALQALAAPGIVLHGWVEDVAPLFASVRLSVAPLRFGAGFKGKVATSLAYGVPVVGTPMAFEGTGLAPGDGIAVGADAAALAREILRLHDDALSWGALSQRGQERVEALYSPQAASELYQRMLADLGLTVIAPLPVEKASRPAQDDE